MGTNTDRVIGQTVAKDRARRDLSQAAVAEKMRNLSEDHKWSQATVWAIEKGDRPLRAAETVDLGHVLGCGSGVLVSPGPAATIITDLVERRNDIRRGAEAIEEALSQMTEAAESLERLIEHHPSDASLHKSIPEEIARLERHRVSAARPVHRLADLKDAIQTLLAEAGTPDLYHHFI